MKKTDSPFPTNYSVDYAKYAPKSFSWKHIEKPAFDLHLDELYKKNITVIDAGCGPGRTIHHLISRGINPDNITGIDIDKKLLDIARKNNSFVNYLHGDLVDISIPENSFNLITCCMVMEYFDQENLEKVLANFYTWLKNDGTLFYITSHPLRLIGNKIETYQERRWIETIAPWGSKMSFYYRTLSDFINATVKAGFTITSLDEPPPNEAGKKDNLLEYEKYKNLGASRLVIKAKK